MIAEAFRNGGFGMFVVLVFGVALLAAAAKYAARPDGKLVPLLVALGILTLSSGGFGFAAGLIVTSSHLDAVAGRDPYLPFIGIGEAMNCVAFALLFIVLASVGASLGALRIARNQPNDA